MAAKEAPSAKTRRSQSDSCFPQSFARDPKSQIEAIDGYWPVRKLIYRHGVGSSTVGSFYPEPRHGVTGVREPQLRVPQYVL